MSGSTFEALTGRPLSLARNGAGMLLFLLIAGMLLRIWNQHREIRFMRKDHDGTGDASAITPARRSGTNDPRHRQPSVALLQARAEVAELLRLQNFKATAPKGGVAPDRSSARDEVDLERLMKDRLPSGFPDFVAKEHLVNRGHDTAAHALETYYWCYAAPGRMTAKSMDELWWQPPEPAPDGYHYEIGLGQGIGSFTGYRIARVEEVSAGEVVYHLQREESRSVVDEEARFVRIDDAWKRKPSIRLVRNP
jgi:hypothetical protein